MPNVNSDASLYSVAGSQYITVTVPSSAGASVNFWADISGYCVLASVAPGGIGTFVASNYFYAQAAISSLYSVLSQAPASPQGYLSVGVQTTGYPGSTNISIPFGYSMYAFSGSGGTTFATITGAQVGQPFAVYNNLNNNAGIASGLTVQVATGTGYTITPFGVAWLMVDPSNSVRHLSGITSYA